MMLQRRLRSVNLPVGESKNSQSRVLGLGPGLLLVAVSIALAAALGSPAADAYQASTGGELYAQHCASCHQADGQGLPGAFPPLAGNPAAADADNVLDAIENGRSGPVEVLGQNYDAVMPAVPALTGEDRDAVVAYVVELAGLAGSSDEATDSSTDDDPSTGDTADVASPVGDADRGHDLFIGAKRLENGGGACVGCHTAGTVGNLGGWSLGPDLTTAFLTLGGDQGLTGWLGNPPAPTMSPIFADRPLNEGEIADLVAYLGTTPEAGPPDSSIDSLLVAGLVGVAVLLGGMAIAWRGMRQTYLQRLRSRG